MKRIAVFFVLLGIVLAVHAQSSSLLQSMLQGGNPNGGTGSSYGGSPTPNGTFGGLNAGNAGSLNLPSQSTDLTFGSLTTIPNGRAQLASTTIAYLVTPGDIYTLSFLQNTNAVSVPLIVQADYTIDLGIFGTQNAKGLTFQAFKTQLEKKVAASYPGSSPVVMIQSTGIFTVKVDGEVTKADLAQVWGLEQLSDLFPQIATSFSSQRKVLVHSSDGTQKSYDIFLASRTGDMSADPYLHPGDVVTLFKAERTVTLAGSVYRPGSFQLLPGETLKTLIEFYGSGLTNTARADIASLVRLPNAGASDGAVLFLDTHVADKQPDLVDGDKVTIPSMEDYLPVVYIEGAIKTGTELSAPQAENTFATNTLEQLVSNAQTQGQQVPNVQPTGAQVSGAQTAAQPAPNTSDITTPSVAVAKQYGVDRQQYRPGDVLSRLMRAEADKIQPKADLRRAFIARKGMADTIPVDIEKLLYAYDPKDDVALKAEDRIIVPYGSLDVFVTGEVSRSTWVNTAALTRLRGVVTPLLTRYSSVRDVKVQSEDGVKSYDLFKADRYGDLSQDPFLKPGDIVTVNPAVRRVTISGEIKKPGSYQLLPGEGLKELIELYGNGFTELANSDRISLVRYVSNTSDTGEMHIIDYSQAASTELMNYDSVTVPPSNQLLPVAYFEGAVGAGLNGAALQASQRFPYTYFPGETLSQAAQKMREQFTTVSDLVDAYVLRGSAKIPIDLSRFLFSKDFSADIVLEPADVVLIPFRQSFVSVSGAVNLPGRYPFVPDRTWDYYVNLAGGFDQDKNSGQKVDIIDVKGMRQQKTRLIQPEDSIVAATNSPLYIFGKYAFVVSTVLSLLTTILYVSKL